MNIVDNKTIAEIARKLRMTTGYPQEFVADVLKLCRSTYSYKEQGSTSVSTDDLQRLSALYQVPIDTFFTPALAGETPTGKRIKRKPDPSLENLAALSKEERKLIGLIRFFQADSGSEEMTKCLQEQVRQEIRKK